MTVSSNPQEHAHAPDAMKNRAARFESLTPLPIQQDASIPLAALDLVYARKLLPVIGLPGGAATPITSSAPILGAAGITMTYAVCPPGQGPGLHAHKATYETFVVMQGEFEFTWGETGQEALRLPRLGVLSVPPGVTRAFRNVSTEEGILLVVISGGAHNMHDIHMPEAAAHAIHAASPGFMRRLADSGITYSGELA